MAFLAGTDRDQMVFVSLEDAVAPDSEARVIDAFVDSLDLASMGLARHEPAATGRPAYDPASLLKLYLYGYRNGIRSSRRLERACEVNVEVMWLTRSARPDFRTIANFRRDNAACLRDVFAEFARRVCAAAGSGFQSVDGTKVRASNAKDRCFTPPKLDDRIGRLESHVAEYVRLLDESDAEDGAVAAGRLPREELERRLAEAQERLARYEGYRETMESEGLPQLSLTDPDARLMKARGGFEVAYNVQASVDSETHLITNFEATGRPTDHGLLAQTLAPLVPEGGILEATADRGYDDRADMAACLEAGILPSVILPEGQDAYELEFPHDPAGGDPASTEPAQLSACLRAGKVPEAYARAIESAEVVERSVFVRDPSDPAPATGGAGEARERAALGFFVRDAARNLVVCPAGEVLRQKSVKRDGKIRYANKLACSRCPHRERCIEGSGRWKEVDFPKDVLEKPCGRWAPEAAKAARAARRGHYETRKVVVVRLRPDRSKCVRRMCLSEHPFGTIKRAMGADHFLLRGLDKVNGEFALMATAYNLARGMALLGFEGLMEAVAGRAAAAGSRLPSLLARRLARLAGGIVAMVVPPQLKAGF